MVVARTLEFGVDLDSKIGIFPAGTSFAGTLPNNATGLQFKTKYGMVGANAFGLAALVDGVNDQGLYVGEFFFPGSAQFGEVTSDNASRAMAGYQYSMWILGNFATVAEVKAAYDRVVLAGTVVPAMGIAPPVHFRIVDKTGAAVVVEPIGGKLVIYDDPLGVLTNSPAFSWHMTNLNNYLGLSPVNREPVTLPGAITLSSFGQGSGFYGMPGDYTSPSRFVRAVAFETTAAQPATGADAVQQAFHILNNFDIPVGAVRDEVNGKSVDEWTLWTTAVDLTNLQFNFRTFDNQSLRSVDVRKVLAAAGSDVKYVPMESTEPTPVTPVTL
ncbi:MAG: choloylglycine hydrolase family protein [Candidatus Eremiobacteraeota bacterium]|nr:choloylglycine hydrolase family protein [Candidatus Eremiobacteraeota bacterium]